MTSLDYNSSDMKNNAWRNILFTVDLNAVPPKHSPAGCFQKSWLKKALVDTWPRKGEGFCFFRDCDQ